MMVEIRPVDLAAAASMAELHARCFDEDVWSSSQIADSLALPSTKGWGAFCDGVMVGLLMVQKTGEEGEILTFCVAPSHRQQGIGEKMLAVLIGEADLERIHLEVAADNEPAQKLYQKMGYKEGGRRPSYYKRKEKTVDGVRYVRNLKTDA